MKKKYMTPEMEKIDFCYRDQVVASGYPSGQCGWNWVNYDRTMGSSCTQDYYGDALGN